MTNTETKSLEQAVAEHQALMAKALRLQEKTAVDYLAGQMAKFQDKAGQYGVEYAMKTAAEDLSEAEWELGLKRRMTKVYEHTSSELEMWKAVRELAVQQLCDGTRSGNLFAAADADARHRIAARWLRNADKRLEKLQEGE